MKWLRQFGLLLVLSGQLWAAGPQDDPLYQEGEAAFAEGKYARAREVAEQILKADQRSYTGLLLMGKVYLYGEGSVPRAYGCFAKAQKEVERASSQPADPSGPWKAYADILAERAQAASQLERYEEACRLTDLYDKHFQPKRAPIKGFNILKMGRIEEARSLMLSMIDAPDYKAFRSHTINTLGNLEFEADNLEKSLEYFLQIANEAETSGDIDPVYWGNAGEVARDLLRHDEAERYLLKATEHFHTYTYSDPWGMLAELYASEGRMPEALNALKSMQAWRISGSAQVSQNKWAGCYAHVGSVLMQMGYDKEALQVFEKLIRRQDRNSSTSSAASLVEARMVFQYAFALQLHCQRLRERLSYCYWVEVPVVLAELTARERQLKIERQRVANLICSDTGIDGFLQPYGAKSLDQPALSPASWAYFGSGPTIASAQRSLASNKPEMEKRLPYLKIVLGEAYYHGWQTKKAQAILEEALVLLPTAEVKLRYRCQAVLADILTAQGKHSEALHYLRQLVESDPSQLRACRLALPIRIESQGGRAAEQAARWLALSPRLRRAREAFVLQLQAVDGGQRVEGRLLGPDGTLIGSYKGLPKPDAQEAARSFCETFHQQAFAPVIDLSQLDIKSINGSTGVAQPKNLKDLIQ